ncbi:MAG TPA: MFS transporter [Fimbriiglobus sp.]|jgi:hypothetical protein
MSVASSSPGLKLKLSVMMFLQFFIWGAWFEIGFSYIPSLKFEDWQNDLVFDAFNIGALVALFFSAQLVDRKFAAEKFLAFSHLIGGGSLIALSFLQTYPVGTEPGTYNSVQVQGQGDVDTQGLGKLTDGTTVRIENLVPTEKAAKYWEDFAKIDAEKRPIVTFVITTKDSKGLAGDASTPLAPFWPFFLLMLIHSIFYVPTISITNAIAFNAFTNPDKQFGPVRVWGTIGWIAASWPFIFILTNWADVPGFGSVGIGEWLGKVFGSPLVGAAAQEGKKYVFLVGGLAALVLAAFSTVLPHTPPKPASGEDSLAWWKALKTLMASPFMIVLFVVTFIDAAVHQSYFFWTFDFLTDAIRIPANWAGPVMKIGQIAEILTMLILGWVLKSLGWRWTMILGVLGHAARFAVFAFVKDQTPVILIFVVHGICYAFFFATVYIFVDKYFPKDVRSSAQGLFNVLILGVGPFVANSVCGRLKGMYTSGGKLDYPVVFEYSLAAALGGALLLLFFFHPPKKTATE